jgi:hypothetical protein
MRLEALIFGFVAVALIAGMIVFVSSTQSLEVVDSYGNVSSERANTTTNMAIGVTAVGGTATGYLVLVIAALGICGGVAFLYLYSRKS